MIGLFLRFCFCQDPFLSDFGSGSTSRLNLSAGGGPRFTPLKLHFLSSSCCLPYNCLSSEYKMNSYLCFNRSSNFVRLLNISVRCTTTRFLRVSAARGIHVSRRYKYEGLHPRFQDIGMSSHCNIERLYPG